MSRGGKYQSRHERRLRLSYSNLTKISPAGTSATTSTTRPHGGYRGVTEQYPLSINAFDKPEEYIENVKNSVRTRYVEEENERCGSPQWVPRYNSDINHTGEQPLIVQHYLSGNKQEQRNGVLPAHVEVTPRLKSASHRHREERTDYHHGNSTHQYLTATEMPGQSQQLFDIRHGRPTRTSLLRTRHRSHSAPGVRALLEVGYLHKQQQQAAKTEDRFKSVDVPKDLQPLTEIGETVHQFIIGAKYNRNIFRDAKCLAATGVSVSRKGPQNFPNGGSLDNDDITSSSSDSLASTYLQDSNQPPMQAKQAWGNESRPMSRSTNAAPTPTPIDSSRETFTSPSTNNLSQPQQQSTAGAKTIIDGSTLHGSHPTAGGCQDCIMCRKGVPLKGMPGTFSKKMDPAKRNDGSGRDAGDRVEKYIKGVSREGKLSDTVDHQLVQQYHLRILGVKMAVDDTRPKTPTPRNKLHYTSNFTKPRAVSASGRRANQNKNNNRRSSTGSDGKLSPRQKKDGDTDENEAKDDTTSMRSSMISVRISTHSFENEDALSEPTPREETAPPQGTDDEELTETKAAAAAAATAEEAKPMERVEEDEKQQSQENGAQGTCNEVQDEQNKDENGNPKFEDESGEQIKESNEDSIDNTENANASQSHNAKDDEMNDGNEMEGGAEEVEGSSQMVKSEIGDAFENLEIDSEKVNEDDSNVDMPDAVKLDDQNDVNVDQSQDTSGESGADNKDTVFLTSTKADL